MPPGQDNGTREPAVGWRLKLLLLRLPRGAGAVGTPVPWSHSRGVGGVEVAAQGAHPGQAKGGVVQVWSLPEPCAGSAATGQTGRRTPTAPRSSAWEERVPLIPGDLHGPWIIPWPDPSLRIPERLLEWDVAQLVDPCPWVVGVWAENREAKTPHFSTEMLRAAGAESPTGKVPDSHRYFNPAQGHSRCWWLETLHGASLWSGPPRAGLRGTAGARSQAGQQQGSPGREAVPDGRAGLAAPSPAPLGTAAEDPAFPPARGADRRCLGGYKSELKSWGWTGCLETRNLSPRKGGLRKALSAIIFIIFSSDSLGSRSPAPPPPTPPARR